MQFFGNDSDPFAKTLKEIDSKSKETNLGSAGDFFSSVCERDPFTKPKNSKQEEIEFNAAILELDHQEAMKEYIYLKNRVIQGDCMAIEETQSVDKESGAITVFVKWLQPKGAFVLGTTTKNRVDMEDITPVDDTQVPAPKSTPTSGARKHKGKGSRKKNKTNGGGYGSL